MADNVYFKEDPQQIANTAALIQRERGSFSDSLSGMKTKALGMKSYWKSDSADEYQKNAAALDLRGQDLIMMFNDLVGKLQQASGIYTTAESTAKNASQGLPTDGVFR